MYVTLFPTKLLLFIPWNSFITLCRFCERGRELGALWWLEPLYTVVYLFMSWIHPLMRCLFSSQWKPLKSGRCKIKKKQAFASIANSCVLQVCGRPVESPPQQTATYFQQFQVKKHMQTSQFILAVPSTCQSTERVRVFQEGDHYFGILTRWEVHCHWRGGCGLLSRCVTE